MYKKVLLMIVSCFLAVGFGSCKRDSKHAKAKQNHLAGETSVYLLQHAHNPVDWYPWKEEALQKSKRENKLIIVSIGYSSCHWCHVMERESFSDTAVSRIMNRNFVSIKVDREERPDIDNVYMTACQILNQDGGCGWPLNAVCLPDGRPVWVGTYVPKDDWIKLIEQIHSLFIEDVNELELIASQIQNHLEVSHKFEVETQKPFEIKALDSFHQQVLTSFDFIEGGKTGQLKFPLPGLLQYAMEYQHRTKDNKTKEWIERTLKTMFRRGIHDALEGGFSRYATDPEWKVPHFEKMLYDNAQLISAYAMAFQLYGDSVYLQALVKTVQFFENHFVDPKGYLHASYDAESEGEEGKYYVWTLDEVRQLIPNDRAFQIFIAYYAITAEGNWEKGKNVLSAYRTIDEMQKLFSTDANEITQAIEVGNEALLKARLKRNRPKKDDKVVCSWNAMAAKAYADAYAASGNANYKKRAIAIADFIKSNLLMADYSLRRTLRMGKADINAFLDDYAFTIQAFLRLYEISFDEIYLHLAKNLCAYAIQNFSDDQDILFYFNSKLDPKLITRKIEMDDQVIPSTNSVMCENLYKLGLYYYEDEFLTRSKSMMQVAIKHYIRKGPVFFFNWLRVYQQMARPLYEVAIVGDKALEVLQEILLYPIPHAILLGGKTEGGLELLKEKLQEGHTYIYVCRNKVCKFPVKEVSKALALMR